MTKVVYITLENNDVSARAVLDAFVALLDDLKLDSVGKLKLKSITVQQQHGRHGVSDKAMWKKEKPGRIEQDPCTCITMPGALCPLHHRGQR